MNLDAKTLPNDPDALKKIVLSLASANAEMEESFQKRIMFLEERIRLLTIEIFGRKSERQLPASDQKQLNLFGQPEPEPTYTDDKTLFVRPKTEST